MFITFKINGNKVGENNYFRYLLNKDLTIFRIFQMYNLKFEMTL